MEVPLIDIKSQYVKIREEVRVAIDEVLDPQACLNSPKIQQLEQAIAAYSGCQAGIGCSSGTDAILMTLMALGIGPGDEVITTPYTFFATGGCIARTCAKPVFVDIDPRTYNIDPRLAAKAVTKKTKAIIPVHLYGQMADMDPLMELARANKLKVIEDAAQSIGSTYRGRKACSIGDAGCLSFYPTKNLGAMGDAGMVCTTDAKVAEMCRIMRAHGGSKTYIHEYIGGNFRIDGVQAAALLVKLKYLPEWTEARRRNAAYYDRKFPGVRGIVTPYIEPWNYSIYNQYIIRVPERAKVIEHLKQKKVGHSIYYPLPLHLQDCFSYLGYKPGDLPHAEQAARETLALPIYPELSDAMKDYVVDSIAEAM